jgi:ketosteroid isomerase-like protein
VRFGKASDVDGVLACVTPDFGWRLAKGLEAPDGLIVRGKEVVRQALAERAAVIQRIRFSETEVTIVGDSIIDGSALPGERATGAPILA